jgi:hypothetical protein
MTGTALKHKFAAGGLIIDADPDGKLKENTKKKKL